jgi:hypothetical protein
VPISRFLVWGALLLSTHASGAVILSDNLANATAGAETASGNTWLAASFGTSLDALSLTSATLLLSSSAANSTAQLSLYSDGGLEPGTMLGNFTSPASFSITLSPTVFTATGLSLSTSSTYWIVLKAISGDFNWAWTTDNTGTGTGFQHTWALSDNAGGTWFPSDTFPSQFAVSADTPGASPVPEPSSFSVMTAGAATLLAYRRLSRRERS